MNRKLAAIAAAAVMLLGVGCTDNGDSSSDSGADTTTTPASSSQSSPVQDGGSGGTPAQPSGLSVLTSGTPLDTVIAAVEGNADMNITFGDFLKEYKYRLAGYQVTDDNDPMYASTLQSEREYIVNYLINEKIMHRKFEELGFTLSDEDNALIDSDTAAGIESIKKSLEQRIKDTELLSEDDLAKRVEEEYEKLMTDCGLTYEDIRGWQTGIVIQGKLTDYLNADYVYDPANTEQQVQTLIDSAKESYASDPANYDPNAMASLWIPEGSRAVKHILLKFDDEAMEQISTLRSEGKDDEADKLVNENLNKLSDKINEVNGYVSEGQNFEELMSKYSDDGDTTMTYIICPDTELYMEGFAETAFEIPETGRTQVCVTDYGWHLIKYIEDAVVTEDELNDYKTTLHRYMEEQYRAQNYSAAIKEWRAAYTFEIDREILLLAEEDSQT